MPWFHMLSMTLTVAAAKSARAPGLPHWAVDCPGSNALPSWWAAVTGKDVQSRCSVAAEGLALALAPAAAGTLIPLGGRLTGAGRETLALGGVFQLARLS